MAAVGARRRGVAFFGLAVLAGGAVVVALLAPLLLRAAEQASFAAATPRSSLLAVQAYGPLVPAVPELGQGVAEPADLLRTAPTVVTTVETVPWQRVAVEAPVGRTITEGHLVATFGCAGARIAVGRCPSGIDDTAVSSASGIPVGARLRLTSAATRPLVVVGQYEPASGGPLTDPVARAAVRSLGGTPQSADLLVVSSRITTLVNVKWLTVVGVGPTRPLRLEDVERVRRGLIATRAQVRQVIDGSLNMLFPQIVATEQTTAEAARLVALALVVQALVAVWAAQALFVGALARDRAVEWGITRLRGFRFWPRLVALFAEPLASVLLGTVGGLVLAAVTAQMIAMASVGVGVQPLEPLPLALGGLAVLGTLIALLLASIRGATLPLAVLLRSRSEPRRMSRAGLVAQSGSVLATVLVVVSVVTSAEIEGPQLPLLAPALIAVATAIVALRLAVPLLRRSIRPSPRSLAGLIAGRRLLRTPARLVPAVVLCIAVALATAAAQTLATTDMLQHERAQALVGASRVLDVHVPVGTDLLAAVRRADPSGHLAMAAVDIDSGAGPQRIVAVDTARLGAVSSWHPEWSGTTAARLRGELAPDLGPSLTLTGRRIDVELADTTLPPDLSGVPGASLPKLTLSITVQNATGTQTLTLGQLNRTSFHRSLPCPEGCRIVDLAIANAYDNGPWAVKTTVRRITTGDEPAVATVAMLRPAAWRNQLDLGAALDPPPTVRFTGGSDGLTLLATATEPSAIVKIAPRDTPQPIPVLAGPDLQLRSVAGVRGSDLGAGLDLEYLLVHPVGRARILPRALGDGVMADLGIMEKVSDPAVGYGRPQVWLAAPAGPAVITALQRQGLQVIGQEGQATVEGDLLTGTIPRVAVQGAIIGCAGLLLALLALLLQRLLRRPALQQTAEVLRTAGAPPRLIRRIAVAEAAVPAAVGALLGAVAGLAGALLVLPILPLGAGQGVLPPLPVVVDPAAALLPAAAAIVLSALIAVITAPGARR